ncbi:MAG: MBL fold metallo-hydrolase [bacterium]|nr:MBL fold metallo-hydrolase [bacterium]
MSDLEIIIVGSASGLPQPDRTHAAIALKKGNDLWLLDAGEAVCSSMLRCGLDPRALRGIYVTHCHPDHCVGLFMLLQYLHMKGARQSIEIYLPGGAIPAFQAFMNQIYLVHGQIHPRYALKPLETQHNLSKELRLQSYPTNHLQRWKELAFPNIETASFAFKITAPGKTIFYSGDVRQLGDIAEVIHGVDLFILEAAHVELEVALQTSIGEKIKSLVLTHALPEQDLQLKALQAKADMSGLEIHIARDGLRLAV